jgi:hypothetical protein
MKISSGFFALIVVCLLSGCATGPRFAGPVAVPDGKAVVYVYRERRGLGSGGSPDIFINGEKVVKLISGGFYIYYADPGDVVFSNQFAIGPLGILWAVVDRIAEAKKRAILQFQAEAGKTYYVEWSLGYKVALREPEQASKILQDCSLLDSAKG